MNHIKRALLDHILATLDDQVAHEQKALENLLESIDDEQKNSSGDALDTGSSSMQGEQESINQQLQETLQLRKRVSQMPIADEYNTVEPGAIAYTSMANFFFAINCDELEIEGEEYMPISIASPLGQALKGKKAGEKFSFRGKDIVISKVE